MTKTRDLADLGGGFIQAGTGAQQRTVESKLQDVVSVLDFIPAGTDTATTDCAAYIQAAFTYAGANGKKAVVPTGTYLISSTITWAVVAGFEVECEPGATLKASASIPVDNKLLLPTATSGSQRFGWKGGTIDGRLMPTRVSGAPDLLYIASKFFKDVTIEGVTFLANDTRAGTAGDSCLFLAEGENYVVTGCSFTGAADVGIYMSGDATQAFGKNCIITNNFFNECNVGYISKRLFLNQIVSNNIVQNTNSGIVVGGEADTTLLPGSRGCISNNYLFKCASVSIEARISNNTTISGNTILDYAIDSTDTPVTAVGVLIQGSSHCAIIGNSISYTDGFTPAAGTDAIYITERTYNAVTYPAENILVQANLIRKCNNGVTEGPGADFNTIIHNSIREETNLGYTVVGTNTFLIDADATDLRHYQRFGSSGATATAGVHELVENSTGHLSQVLVPDGSSWQLLMGDATSATVARTGYYHNVDKWQWRAGGSGVVFQVGANGPEFGTHLTTTDVPITGYIEIVDSGGTTRKLAVIT